MSAIVFVNFILLNTEPLYPSKREKIATVYVDENFCSSEKENL